MANQTEELLRLRNHVRLTWRASVAAFYSVQDILGPRRDHLLRIDPTFHALDAAAYAYLATSRSFIRTADKAAAAEKAAVRAGPGSVLDDLPIALPALARTAKIGRRVARVGFDWPDAEGAFAKVNEEVSELQAEAGTLGAAADARRFEELGDLLFAVCNVARKLDLDPDAALRHANTKFERRFRAVESELARRGKGPVDSDLAEMDAIWEAVKSAESGPARR